MSNLSDVNFKTITPFLRRLMEVVDFPSGSSNKDATELENLKRIELHPIEWMG